MDAAAVIAALLLGVMGAMQLALALGAPLGAAAWGGSHPGVLPPRFRIASAAAALVYPVLIGIVLAAAGVTEIDWLPANRIVMWVLFGFFALGAVLNSASRSKPERVWGPVSAVIAVCCLIIVLSM